MNISRILVLSALCLVSFLRAEDPAPASIPSLVIKGSDFVDAQGHPVKFWGVNLVALYPDHASADALAANLASLQINLARPHHILRPSTDWNPGLGSGALLTYKDNSREFDPNILDRFDYLNAALRKQGIYLSLSVNWTRRYLPGDFDILPGEQAERDGWTGAMKELSEWPWKKAMDVYKMLPMVDERAALLNEEFIKKFLTHVNPFTGKSYAEDPQVLTFEVMNESSIEYSVICGNKLPDYWQNILLEKWAAFAKEAGIEPGDLYKPADTKTKMLRAKFLNQLDEAYFERIKKVVRATGCQAPMTFSNLWRGDNMANMNARTSDWIEDHLYMDPLVVRKPQDGIFDLSRSALAGKPFFVGEFNQAEGDKNIQEQSPYRSMLPAAVAAYASLQDWSGITWFAWIHGSQNLGADGWAKHDDRKASIGEMIGDGMMADHIRTTGFIFRHGLIKKSAAPFTLWVDEPFTAGNYSGLMDGKYNYKPGWQDIHQVRKAFGSVPPEQKTADWMKQTPPNPLVSDTGEIVKDIQRQQLTVTAPQAEIFSGYPDALPPTGIPHLALGGQGFSTVVLVALDGKDLGESQHLILSRSALNSAKAEIEGPSIALSGLAKAANGQTWQIKLTRPRPVKPDDAREIMLTQQADGTLLLPGGSWHECEIFLASSPTALN